MNTSRQAPLKPDRALLRDDPFYRYSFHAMATPCEIQILTDDAELAESTGKAVADEARRIEQKFSRYRSDSVIGHINASAGTAVDVDDETAQLIDFAVTAYRVSGGLFDITSGVLRRAWQFDGSDRVPDQSAIRAAKSLVGWSKVEWRRPTIKLQVGMEIDLGGIGKEYAVDRAVVLGRQVCPRPFLVNFGGDLEVSGACPGPTPWRVAIEAVDRAGTAAGMLDLFDGALATSGDARRYLLKNGIRYSHILNPRAGQPVVDPPRSVTVAATTCVEAGILATVAMLHGRNAERFLKTEGIRAWCIR